MPCWEYFVRSRRGCKNSELETGRISRDEIHNLIFSYLSRGNDFLLHLRTRQRAAVHTLAPHERVRFTTRMSLSMAASSRVGLERTLRLTDSRARVRYA